MKIYTPFFWMLLCLLPYGLWAQQERPVEARFSPEGTFEQVFDRFGKAYLLNDIRTPRPEGPVRSGDADCIPCGFFNLFFEIGSGFENELDLLHQERREVLCQVFTDVSNFIQGADESQKVNIWVRDAEAVAGGYVGFLAAASAFYTVPLGEPDISGIIEGAVWRTINSGHDAFESVALPLNIPVSTTGGSGIFYHGLITFNFNAPHPFHTDLSTNTPEGYYDLYTAALHELTHALDFSSLIDANGESKFGSNYDYYTRYDRFLETSSAEPLISSSTTCDLYDFSFNPTLEPAEDVLAPQMYGDCEEIEGCSYCFDVDCQQSISFAGGVNQKVYTPNCFFGGSSLSHFDDVCHVPDTYPAGEYYVMAYAVDTGPAFQKRSYTEVERQVLCDIGYTVSDQFGDNANLNYTTYSGGTCQGIEVAGTHDGLNEDGTFAYVTLQDEPVYICVNGEGGILDNDHNATGYVCPEVVIGSGTIGTSSYCDGPTLKYTPDEPGIHVLRYVPRNGLTTYGNITYILVYVEDPACVESCEMLPNGGFEDTNDDVVCEPYLFQHLVCWRSLTQTPSLFGRDCEENPLNTIPLTSTFSDPAGVDTWDDGGDGSNNRFVMLRGTSGAGENGIYEESVQARLSTPILPGATYTLSFWARVGDGTSFTLPIPDATVTFCGHSVYPYNPPGCPECEYTPTDYDAELWTVTVPYNELDNTWQYFTTTFTYDGSFPLRNLIVGYNATENTEWSEITAVFVDDINLEPIPPDFDLPSPLCIGNILEDLEGYAPVPGGTFEGDGVLFNGTEYFFFATEAGVFEVDYTFTDPNNPLCPITVTTEIEVMNATVPSVIAQADPGPVVCPGGSVTLNASGADTYTWSPSQWLDTDEGAQVVATPGSSLSYTVTGTNAEGCFNTATIDIYLDEFTVGADPSNTVCDGNAVTLTAINGSGFTWSPATGLDVTSGPVVVASPSETTTYSVIGTTTGGCVDTVEITVFVNPSPVLTVSEDVEICEGETVELCAEGAVTYVWTPQDGLGFAEDACVDATPEETITYTVTGTANSCSASDTVTVTVLPLPHVGMQVDPEQTDFCYDDAEGEITFTAFGADYYYWYAPISAGYAVQTVSIPDQTTEYCVHGTVDGCASEVVCLTIEIQTEPEVDALLVPPSCGNTDGSISLTPTNGTGFSYNWSDPALPDAGTVTGLSGGYYYVTITTTGGCTDVFTYYLDPDICCGFSATGWVDDGCRCTDGSSIEIMPFGLGTFTYNWAGPAGYSADTEEISNLYMEGFYNVTVTNEDGCQELLTFEVAFDCPADFNCDGLVNVDDMLMFLGAFGNNCGTSYSCPEFCCYDLNQDCIVNTADLNLFLGAFGSTCVPEMAVSPETERMPQALSYREDGVWVYPNPSQGQLTIQVPGETPKEPVPAWITDYLGQIRYQSVLTNKETQLDVGHLSSGVYMINLLVGDELFTEKIVLH